MTENNKINNLYSYLKNTKENEIIIRTSMVTGGWHDNEFDANAAGFNISRFTNKEMTGFNECYKITRK